ncbi:MAG TPA: TauD/TfdA family dioxygenase [Usitatibacter sp.]|nr:TauD/TfdA family dioxygenase [Usitatibacter sp.]
MSAQIQSHGEAAIPTRPFDTEAAWRGPDLLAQPARWTHRLAEPEIGEIDRAIEAVKRAGTALDRLSPATFSLPTLAPRLARILDRQLLDGLGFWLVQGLPVERYSIEEAAIAYLGIGSHFGSFRSQNAKGHLLGHVRDLGLDVRNANVRYYQTTRQLEYHTDSCDIVGLLCLKGAKSGGESRIVSSVTLFNEMLRRRPDLLAELFHAFPTDRRGEVPPGMKPWFDVPVFNWYAGYLTTIYVGQYIRSAQENFAEARRLTAAEREALEFLDALANDPQLNLQMTMVPGDMQFLHNHQILHSRTDFEDWEEPERKRHLLRLWIAPTGARPLPPAFAPRYGGVVPGERGGIVTAQTRLRFVLHPE